MRKCTVSANYGNGGDVTVGAFLDSGLMQWG